MGSTATDSRVQPHVAAIRAGNVIAMAEAQLKHLASSGKGSRQEQPCGCPGLDQVFDPGFVALSTAASLLIAGVITAVPG